ncbi:hypothetical protein Tco_0772797, partial [Tanacetum coccineum]
CVETASQAQGDDVTTLCDGVTSKAVEETLDWYRCGDGVTTITRRR